MKLVVISHKECWADPTSSSKYSTIGGFPFQMQAISELFDQTTLLLPVFKSPLPSGTRPLAGRNLSVIPLSSPRGANLRRKVSLLLWLPHNLPKIWKKISETDAVHALVPGDIGTIGIFVAVALRKPLFVRHCGTWNEPVTTADHFLIWLLERIAGGCNVVMATGGGDNPPCKKNPNIDWIFSTTLSENEISSILVRQPWQRGKPLRLVTVGRATFGKNISSIIQAIPLLKKCYSWVLLDIVGDGPYLNDLKKLAEKLDVTKIIRFHGNIPHEQVIKILAESHLFVFPTRVKEGFPKAVLEALVCGLPVIGTGVSVIPHLIGNRNGIVLYKTDPETVAKGILEFIADDQRFAEASFTARQTGKEYTLERWQQVIGERLQASWGPLRKEPVSPQHLVTIGNDA